jgi:hypothetical protein
LVAATVPATKMPSKPGFWDLLVQGVVDQHAATSAPTGLAALEQELKKGRA